MAREFQRHARTVTLLTFASRVGGLARDAAMSRVFGAGALMDAFAFAFMVPNLFRRLFGEGALSAAFLPEYARWADRDPLVARRLAWIVVGGATVVVSALAILAEIAVGALAASGTLEPLAWRLVAIMLPFAPLVCLTALLGAMLQAHHRFGPTAAAPIVLNLLLVAASIASLSLDPDVGITLVAAAVLVAGAVQVAWSIVALRREAPIARGPASDEASQAARQVARLALPMILGLGVLQLNTLLDGFIASWPTMFGPTILGVEYPLAEGSMAKLSWAQRLYEFPLGVFGIAVATAIFPALSRLAHDEAAFAAMLRRGARLVVFIGLPASAGLMLVAEPLSAVVLEGRAFTAEDTRATAWILLGYAPAVWAYSLNQVLVRGFYARGDSMTPVRIAMGLVGLNLLLNLAARDRGPRVVDRDLRDPADRVAPAGDAAEVRAAGWIGIDPARRSRGRIEHRAQRDRHGGDVDCGVARATVRAAHGRGVVGFVRDASHRGRDRERLDRTRRDHAAHARTRVGPRPQRTG
jgi:putative peptidoglycan lipid II flippase